MRSYQTWTVVPVNKSDKSSPHKLKSTQEGVLRMTILMLQRAELGAGAAQSVQCLTTDWATGVRSPTEAEDCSSSLCVQTGSGAHPASCTMGTGGPFTGGKARPGRDADHSPPYSADVKYE
jgi:hypothetical protein